MTTLYPTLESVDDNFRRIRISEIKTFLEKEIEDRRKLYNKYKKGYTACDNINNASSIISTGCGIAGMTLLVTVVSTPIVIGLECVALTMGGVAIVANFANKKLLKKLEKHEKIMTLAISKLNTICDLVSKAIEDKIVDQQEFKLILSEYEKYIELKNTIRKDVRNELSQTINVDSLKKDFLEKARKDLTQELIQKLK
jgi:autonomous glycyl radical cofactor GrcA